MRGDLDSFTHTLRGLTGLIVCDPTEEYFANKKLVTDAFHRFLREPENVDALLHMESVKAKNLFDGCVKNSCGFSPLESFQTIIPSMFLAMMYGLDLPHDDSVLQHMASTYRLWFEAIEPNNPADFLPLLARFPNKRLDIIRQTTLEVDKCNSRMVKERIDILENRKNKDDGDEGQKPS